MRHSIKSIGFLATVLMFGCGGNPAPDKPATPAPTPATQPQNGAALVKAAHSGKQNRLKIDPGTPIDKAPGETGRTVAELYAEKADLAGKQVSVRGKVTKFNPAIMGRNWLHIQDGSGSEETNDYEITATSRDSAVVGDVVLLRGKLSLDRDFGAGYAYSIIIEDASIQK